MNEGDRVDDVLAVDRAMTQLESRRLSAVYELVCTARETVGNQFAERSVREELRLARRVSPGECVGLVELAVILHERYPELLACLAAGLLDQYRAEQACQVLQSLTIEQTRAATARIAERLRTGERPFHWREYVRRVADAVAPEAKRRRTAAVWPPVRSVGAVRPGSGRGRDAAGSTAQRGARPLRQSGGDHSALATGPG